MRTINCSAVDKPTVWQVLRRIDDVSTLSHVGVRVLEVANDPEATADDLREVLEGDPVMTARVLRCVNSSAYGVRDPITNLQQAIVYLGVKQIRDLVLVANLHQLFAVDGGIGPYRRAALWRHMVAVGICARMIASRENFSNTEDVFLAGLLHDIGIVLEDQFAHQPFCRMVARSLSLEKTLIESEREHFAFDHATLGMKFAQRWGFPELATAAIAYHHGSLDYDGTDKLSVRCVEMANVVCSAKGITSMGLNLVTPLDPERTGLRITREDLMVLAGKLDGELARHGGLFDI